MDELRVQDTRPVAARPVPIPAAAAVFRKSLLFILFWRFMTKIEKNLKKRQNRISNLFEPDARAGAAGAWALAAAAWGISALGAWGTSAVGAWGTSAAGAWSLTRCVSTT